MKVLLANERSELHFLVPNTPMELRRSDWNIQQIITYVGYENTSYFYRLFHERYGQSPREYRQSRAARTRTPA